MFVLGPEKKLFEKIHKRVFLGLGFEKLFSTNSRLF